MRLHTLCLVLSACAPGEIEGPSDDSQSTPIVGDAARYTLWIHGYSPLGRTTPGEFGAFGGYFGPSGTAAGVNKRAVQWGGQDAISVSNVHVRNALDCFCTGSNWCYVATHSTGDPQIGYALSHYGGSARELKDATRPRSDGSCDGDGSRRTQTGWNISWVLSAGGAEGGSELAVAGKWLSGAQPLEGLKHGVLANLNPPTMRALYDHDQTRGVSFRRFVGGSGGLWSMLLPGQDDQLVSYHSSGGVAKTGSFCNPGDWFCDGQLTRGSAATSNGVRKYKNHDVTFLDENEDYNHHTMWAWAGITGVARRYAVDNAR